MPKVTDTRKNKAKTLVELLETGPVSLNDKTGCDKESFNLWCRSWVLPLVRELVPELKPPRK
jgi:hypothetical protein